MSLRVTVEEPLQKLRVTVAPNDHNVEADLLFTARTVPVEEPHFSRTDGISNAQIDEWYDIARRNGALGGKLVGAGAGGFLLFYAEDPKRVRRAIGDAGLPEVRFGFDHDGSVVLARS